MWTGYLAWGNEGLGNSHSPFVQHLSRLPDRRPLGIVRIEDILDNLALALEQLTDRLIDGPSKIDAFREHTLQIDDALSVSSFCSRQLKIEACKVFLKLSEKGDSA